MARSEKSCPVSRGQNSLSFIPDHDKTQQRDYWRYLLIEKMTVTGHLQRTMRLCPMSDQHTDIFAKCLMNKRKNLKWVDGQVQNVELRLIFQRSQSLGSISLTIITFMPSFLVAFEAFQINVAIYGTIYLKLQEFSRNFCLSF